jgi:hypothetical protein
MNSERNPGIYCKRANAEIPSASSGQALRVAQDDVHGGNMRAAAKMPQNLEHLPLLVRNHS